MEYLFKILSSIILILISQRFLNYYYSKPEVIARRFQKSKLPAWIIFLELLLFICFLFILFFILISNFNFLLKNIFILIFVLITLVPISGILTNFVLWSIPKTRKISEENSAGIKGLSFYEANLGLLKVEGFLIFALIAILIFSVYF